MTYEDQGTAHDPFASSYEIQGRSSPPRLGDWIQTYRGTAIYPMDARVEEIDIVDIAHSLSMQCRYAGHCLDFYSVAEHSVLIARWLAEQGASAHDQMWGLLHDATEAYLVDVPRPVKPFLVGYKEAEARLHGLLSHRFQLSRVLPTIVKEADDRILFDEKAQNMAPGAAWSISAEPLGVTLQCWSPLEAEAAFLAEYYRIIETGRF